MKKLYLIDGMSMVFRAYHAMLRSGLQTPKGEPAGAVFGFTNILTTLMDREGEPANVAVVFDTSEPTFRHERYEEYKANRAEFPEQLVPQLARIKELLDLMGIPQVELDGYEADDIIGTLAKRAQKQDVEAYCVTSDKDLYQLVDQKIKLLKPAGTRGELEEIGYGGVEKKFGVKPDQVIEVLALVGDTSDNIPGVKGIGEKTAIPLIQKYGNIDNLYDHLDEIEKKSVRNKLEEKRENAFLSRELLTIMVEAPIDLKIDDCVRSEPKFLELDKFFAEQGFNRLRQRWREKAGDKVDYTQVKEPDADEEKEESEEPNRLMTINDTKHEYIFVNTVDKIDKMLDELSDTKLLSFDLETSSLDRHSCEIVGIALSGKKGAGYYIPVDENLEDIEYFKDRKQDDAQASLFKAEEQQKQKNKFFSFPTNAVLEKIKNILEDEKIGKCGQNIKFDAYILLRYGVDIHPIIFDSMIASFLLNPDSKHNMQVLSEAYLNYSPVPISRLIGEKKKDQISMRDVEPEEISDYACEDADIALQLCNVLRKELEKEGILNLANDIEFPMVEVLARMENNGVAIDTEALKELSERITKEAENLTNKIYDEAGTEFNIDSTKQLGQILFDRLQIPPVKKTKTGYSTDVQVLTQLAEQYDIAHYILEYRQIQKLKSTYIDALPKLINPRTKRLHTNYQQTVASTGRLSSIDPNLQNIPIRSELGKEVRRAFVPQSKDAVILSTDYSQVELRIMAYICGDEHLIKAFEQGLDIHSATAAALYGMKLEDVTSDMRRIAKTVNFGIMYGLGAYGMSQRLGISRSDSQQIIDNYFKKYPGIRKYIDMTIENAREKGYAETLCGRRRYFKDMNSDNANLRRQAERAAINMPIQGTASDMMKIAMINVDREMRKKNYKSLMMLQVHDELVFEAYNDELDELKAMVEDKMKNALSLGRVPVDVDSGIGKNWFEAH